MCSDSFFWGGGGFLKKRQARRAPGAVVFEAGGGTRREPDQNKGNRKTRFQQAMQHETIPECLSHALGETKEPGPFKRATLIRTFVFQQAHKHTQPTANFVRPLTPCNKSNFEWDSSYVTTSSGSRTWPQDFTTKLTL